MESLLRPPSSPILLRYSLDAWSSPNSPRVRKGRLPPMRISSAAACLVLAAASVVPFRPWAQGKVSPSAFEIRVESDHPGLVELYYQLGPHFIEDDAAIQPIEAGHPTLLRFALPYGTIRGLRFDPLDREAHLTLGDARIVDGAGRVTASFPPEAFRPMNQIQLLEVRGGRLYVETTPGGTDPQLSVSIEGPFTLARPRWEWAIARVFAVLVGCLLAAEWAVRSRSVRLAERARSLWSSACASPERAVLVAALLGTVCANYPVIFAAKSVATPGLVGGSSTASPLSCRACGTPRSGE